MNAPPPPPPIRRNKKGSVVHTARRAAAREASSRRAMREWDDVLNVRSNRTVGRESYRRAKSDAGEEKRVFSFRLLKSLFYLHLIEVGGVTDIFEL